MESVCKMKAFKSYTTLNRTRPSIHRRMPYYVSYMLRSDFLWKRQTHRDIKKNFIQQYKRRVMQCDACKSLIIILMRNYFMWFASSIIFVALIRENCGRWALFKCHIKRPFKDSSPDGSRARNIEAEEREKSKQVDWLFRISFGLWKYPENGFLIFFLQDFLFHFWDCRFGLFFLSFVSFGLKLMLHDLEGTVSKRRRTKLVKRHH